MCLCVRHTAHLGRECVCVCVSECSSYGTNELNFHFKATSQQQQKLLSSINVIFFQRKSKTVGRWEKRSVPVIIILHVGKGFTQCFTVNLSPSTSFNTLCLQTCCMFIAPPKEKNAECSVVVQLSVKSDGYTSPQYVQMLMIHSKIH